MDYNMLASQESIDATVAALKANHFDAIVVESGADALAKIKEFIPQGASVMNGASTTLEQIGYIAYLEAGQHGWNNLKEAILKEKDPQKQSMLRKQSVVSDYYAGSAQGVTQDGSLVFASNTGSQLPHLAFTSKNIILIVSTKKIGKDLPAVWDRLENHIVPLEDARLMKASNAHTLHAKTLILHKENPKMGRKILVVFVKEDLGF